MGDDLHQSIIDYHTFHRYPVVFIQGENIEARAALNNVNNLNINLDPVEPVPAPDLII